MGKESAAEFAFCGFRPRCFRKKEEEIFEQTSFEMWGKSTHSHASILRHATILQEASELEIEEHNHGISKQLRLLVEQLATSELLHSHFAILSLLSFWISEIPF